MNRIIFNKLVRDKIPEIIKNNNQIPEIEILDDLIYQKMLDKKLLEECHEVIEATDKTSKIEEMADLLDINLNDIEKIRLDKKEKRGAFKKKILLKSTT
jgi:Uncharacterized conserved protein